MPGFTEFSETAAIARRHKEPLSDALDDKPTIYTVRLSDFRVREREMEQIVRDMEDWPRSEILPVEWYQGIRFTIRGLSENPRRYAVQEAESQKLREEVRRDIYRSTPGSSAANYLFYSVEDAGDDGPLVTILHIRHASRKPMTRAEAKDIRAGK